MATTKLELQQLLEQNATQASSEDPNNSLSKLNFTEEQIAILRNANDKSQSKDPLDKILIHQGTLLQISKSLITIVNALDKDPSVITQVIERWGGLNLWQRLAGYSTVSLPLLALGFIVNFAFIVTLTTITFGILGAGGVLCDQHLRLINDMKQKLKEGILNMAMILELVVASLDTICRDLDAELQRLKTQNSHYEINVNKLHSLIDNLSEQLTGIALSEEILRTENDKLTALVAKLQRSGQQYQQEITTSQEKIKEVRHQHERALKQLEQKKAELIEVKTLMEREIDGVKNLNVALNEALTVMASTDICTEEQQNTLVLALKENAKVINEHFHTTYTELVEVKAELKKYKESTEVLVQKYEEQKQHWGDFETQLQGDHPGTQFRENAGSLLSELGFMAKNKNAIDEPATERPDPTLH